MNRPLLAALFLALTLALATSAQARPVTVVYHDSPPVIFRDASGHPSGFFATLLEHTAQREGWDLIWVYRSWPEAFGMIRRGEADLMPDVAYSDARAEYLAFNRVTALADWGHIYARRGLDVRSVFDVRGKTVLLHSDDTHANAFRSMMRRFGVDYFEHEVGSQDEILAGLSSGKADIGVVNHLFAATREPNGKVLPTAIVLNPIELRFAAPKSVAPELLDALDRDLSQMKADTGSLYYTAMHTWFGNSDTRKLPTWLFKAFWATGILGLLFALWIVALRIQVTRKTRELAAQNKRLEREIEVRLQAEKALLEAQNSITGVIDSMPSLLAGVDARGRVTFWNQTAWEQTGIPRPQAEGRPLVELLPHLADIDINLTEAATSNREMHLPRITRLHGAALRHEDVTVFPLSCAVGACAVVRVDDVSERVRLEELTIQSEKMLSLGGLAAGMAHEINNPLGIILQNAQNVQRRLSDDLAANTAAAHRFGIELSRVREYLESRNILLSLDAIREAGKRAADIVSNMLTFSRPSESMRRPADIHALLEEALTLARNEYGVDGTQGFHCVTVVREFDPGLPMIPVVRTELLQVFLNLLRNATQAMLCTEAPTAAPVLVLRTALVSGRLCIEVEDNGPGLTPSARTRVFEPFFTTKAPGRGTGLGLSVSYFIITRNHRGTFTAGNAPGGGARFTISLPLE